MNWSMRVSSRPDSCFGGPSFGRGRAPGDRPGGRSSCIFILATLPCDALSAFLAFCGHVVYTPYLSAPRLFGVSPLRDQAFAGALMWVSVTFAYLIPAVFLTTHFLSRADAEDERLTATQQHARPEIRGHNVGTLLMVVMLVHERNMDFVIARQLLRACDSGESTADDHYMFCSHEKPPSRSSGTDYVGY